MSLRQSRLLRRECISGLHFLPTGFKLLLEILARSTLIALPRCLSSSHRADKKKQAANLMTASSAAKTTPLQVCLVALTEATLAMKTATSQRHQSLLTP